MANFDRKNVRLGAHRYVGQSSYFVTLCCLAHTPVFSNYVHAERVIEIMRKHSCTHRFAIHAYCVMPDHVHFLAIGLDSASDLLPFIKNVKQTSSRELRKNANLVLWQKKFYDHILKSTDNFSAAAGYIWMNPVRKGLCADPRDYPFSGSFVTDWKKTMRPLESWVPDWKTRPNGSK